MLKALIFDFDGVIVDTESQWYSIYKEYLKRNYNYELNIKDYLICVGSDSKRLFQFLEKEIGIEMDREKIEAIVREEFIERTKELPAMKGVIELIKEAKKRGLKIALATSSTRTKPVFHLERIGLIQYFDVLSTAELSKNIKPAPDIFLKAVEMLGVLPEECLAIEDSGNGLISAIQAGIRCLIVPNEVTKYSDFSGYYGMMGSLKEVQLKEIERDFK